MSKIGADGGLQLGALYGHLEVELSFEIARAGDHSN